MFLPFLELLSTKRIVLASSSPRRKEILQNIGLNVSIIPSTFEETLDPNAFSTVWDFAIETAFHKAMEVANRLKSDNGNNEYPDLIIGADTIVEKNGKVYGKPADAESATNMLKILGGTTHQVYTGVTLLWTSQKGTNAPLVDKFHETTTVRMASLSDEFIAAYIKSGEPFDKAGAYGIQGLGATMIESIQGDFYTVMGFPLHRFSVHVVNHLKSFCL